MKYKADIMVVDDTLESLALLDRVLTSSGYQVRLADSGEAALAAVAVKAPDLILLDVRMKGIDGLEVCRQIKASEKTRDIPVIMISAYAEIKEWVMAMKLGAVDYVSKPFQFEELLARVETHLNLRQALISAKQYAEELKKAKDQIDRWNQELEIKVAERTEELKKSQEQLIQAEKLTAIGQLASSVAHELNSPLAGLLGLLRMYKKNEKEGTQSYKEIQSMLNAAEHMTKIVGDLSSFSRKTEENFEKLDIENVIDSVSSFGLDQLTKKNIKITKQIDKGLPEIYANKRRLQQVILNMITNAGDAMSQGGEFTIKAKSSSDNKNIVLEFIDTGTGIEEKNLKRIFEPFFTTKEPGKGIGLGLAVSCGIIKAHKGDILVESVVGKGTKFTVLLPISS